MVYSIQPIPSSNQRGVSSTIQRTVQELQPQISSPAYDPRVGPTTHLGNPIEPALDTAGQKCFTPQEGCSDGWWENASCMTSSIGSLLVGIATAISYFKSAYPQVNLTTNTALVGLAASAATACATAPVCFTFAYITTTCLTCEADIATHKAKTAQEGALIPAKVAYECMIALNDHALRVQFLTQTVAAITCMMGLCVGALSNQNSTESQNPEHALQAPQIQNMEYPAIPNRV